MPAKSAAQFGAMMAAARGHSTLGIPASVGRKFIAHTPEEKKRMFGHALLRKRNGQARRG